MNKATTVFGLFVALAVLATPAVANRGLGNISGFREQPERPGGRQPTDNQTSGMN